jgi:glycerol-3-phosphate O-acyltransferase
MSKFELSRELIVSRRNMAFFVAKTLGVTGYKYLTKAHTEYHEDLKALKKDKAVFMYSSLHKSLWETTGILIPLYLDKIPLPYTGMGDNLIRGKFFQNIAQKTGVFLIKRATTRRSMLESARMLKDFSLNYIAHGVDVMVFPEGTRKSIVSHGEYGKFFPTAFDALLEYEKSKDIILDDYPNLSPHNAYIIPTNVDYSHIREDQEMLQEGKPRTLHVLDSFKMLKNIGHTYLTFGTPIRVADHLGMNRKELANFTREKCLELVKILPINVVSQAILRTIDGDRIDIGKIESCINSVLEELSPLKQRFRGFTTEDSPRKLWDIVAKKDTNFREEHVNIKNRKFYKLYADYIGHYMK